MRWYGYECDNPDCPDKSRGDETGTILDLRLPVEIEDGHVPVMACPTCGRPMQHRGAWTPDEGGYGSRGDRSARHGLYVLDLAVSMLRERGWADHEIIENLLEGMPEVVEGLKCGRYI